MHKISDFVPEINREYTIEDIQVMSGKGIVFTDGYKLSFRECCKRYSYPEYVCDRNTITEPMYMRFDDGNQIVILKYPYQKDFFYILRKLKDYGYRTFDAT